MAMSVVPRRVVTGGGGGGGRQGGGGSRGSNNGGRPRPTLIGDPPVPNVFLLRSRKTGDALSVRGAPHQRHDPDSTRGFCLGFVHREDAELVKSVACPKSRTCFVEEGRWDGYSSSIVVGDAGDEGEVPMFPIVAIEKRIDINELPMFMHKMDMQMFLGMPYRNNAGVGLVHQVLHVGSKDVIMEVQTIDAMEMLRLLQTQEDKDGRGRWGGGASGGLGDFWM